MLPLGLAPYVAPVVIGAELYAGLGLLLRRWRRPSAYMLCALLILYAVALGVNRYYNPDSICGCWFSITLGTSTVGHLFQNLSLAALAAWVATEGGPRPVPPNSRRSDRREAGRGRKEGPAGPGADSKNASYLRFAGFATEGGEKQCYLAE